MTHDHKLIVALIQQKISLDPVESLEQSVVHIQEAAKQGARLVVLPELHRHPYFCQEEHPQYFAWAESIPGKSTEVLGKIAKETQTVIVGSLFEKRAPGLYHNTACVIETTGAIAGVYRKMHIPDDPGFYEKFYFTPGDLGFKPIQTSVGCLGVLVCWDQWFPEAARLMALAGAELLIYPTAIAWVPEEEEADKKRQREAWITIQRSHAIANALPTLVCNRVGFEAHPRPSQSESGLLFWGSSFVAGAQGEVLKQGSVDASEILVVEIDKHATERVRSMWPFLRDRRIDAYGDLCRRFVD